MVWKELTTICKHEFQSISHINIKLKMDIDFTKYKYTIKQLGKDLGEQSLWSFVKLQVLLQYQSKHMKEKRNNRNL